MEFELTQTQKLLVELRERYQEQAQEEQQEEARDREKNEQELKKYDITLEKLETELSDMNVKHADIMDELQRQILWCKDQLVQKQTTHEAEMKLEVEDPEIEVRALKQTELDTEHYFRKAFCSSMKNLRENHQTWRDRLLAVKGLFPRVKSLKEERIQQLLLVQQRLMQTNQDLIQAQAETDLYRRKNKLLSKMQRNLQKEVHNLTAPVKLDSCSIKSPKMVDTDGPKTRLEAERSRSTELTMLLKEAHIIFDYIIQEPKIDVQKLRRLQSILESVFPH
uniref:Uncharacterized protein n=1 Tax=Knipowitschia caucasica TaxID=637954 RepID=A0AAV2MSL4_KNICA